MLKHKRLKVYEIFDDGVNIRRAVVMIPTNNRSCLTTQMTLLNLHEEGDFQNISESVIVVKS